MKARLIITMSVILFIAAVSSCAPMIHAQVVISGKVVSAGNHAPVKGALVAVEGVVDVDDVGTHDYVRTDEHGRFTAKAWGTVMVRVWKPGFAMRDIQVGNASDLVGQEISIELRKLQSFNSVPVAINREGMRLNDGFSFSSGKVVDAYSPEADIRIITDKPGADLFLEAAGDGGVYFQAFSADGDFYNTPEALREGYSKRIQIVTDPPGIIYARTRDGKRYAKFRLIQGVKQTARGEDRSAYWLQWAYQPDGTRNLEIAVGPEYGFPFEKFGLTRESLK
jgi:hypothetical protein